MRIGGKEFTISETFDAAITVPDCLVVPSNKIGTGHGESKLYFSSDEQFL